MEVRASRVHGLGVFALRDLKKSRTVRVCRYAGKWVQRLQPYYNRYVVELAADSYLDSLASIGVCVGRYMNDARFTEFDNNCRFGRNRVPYWDPNIEMYWTPIFVTANIPKGNELFVTYGSKYWNRLGFINTTNTSDK